jgi:hypothetical protein
MIPQNPRCPNNCFQKVNKTDQHVEHILKHNKRIYQHVYSILLVGISE